MGSFEDNIFVQVYVNFICESSNRIHFTEVKGEFGSRQRFGLAYLTKAEPI